MQAVFAKILNMSLTGSIVIAVVLLTRLFLKRAPKIYSYALWAVVLFRLLCPLSITAGLSVLKPLPVTTTPGISTVSYRPVAQAVRENIPTPSQQEVVSPQPAEQPEAKLAPMQVAAYIWLGGASVMAAYSVAQYLALRRKLAEAVPLREEIYLADRISSPFVMGIFRPRIYLPSSTPMAERRFVVAHERHHIRRGDPVWKLLGYIALCLHWFNPLVWLAFCLAGKDMEMSCDEAVIKRLGEHIRADYSQALLRLATHKRMVSGMPLAFGEGDTKGRVRNMAKWKKPKVWVSLISLLLSIIILVACAVNPDTAGSKDDIHATKFFGEITADPALNIREKPKASSAVVGNYPSGETVTILETKDGWGRTDKGWIHMDYVTTFGGIMAFPIPEDFSADNWDWLHELPLPEWQDETLGYSAGGSPSVEVTVEFFSDVPDGQERTVLNEHTLYFYEGWIYDLWFDELRVKPEVMESILDTVSVGEEKRIPVVDMPYTILEMPAGGYDYRVEADGSISFLKGDNSIGGIVAYPIPEGVYDPNDDAWLWLEDVGVPDLEDPNLTITGMFSWGGSNGCALTVVDDMENPTVERTHYFRFAGNTLYDFWLDDLAVDEDTRSAIEDAVIYQEAKAQQSGATPEAEMSEEDIAFGKAQAVMMGLQDVPALIQTECRYQNTPEKDYIETFCYDSEIGFLRVTTTADGLDHAQLYVNDRYYTNAGSETSPEPIWIEAEAPSEWSTPWLGSFNFIRHYVTYVDTLSDGEKTSYLFRVNAPFEDTPDAADHYFATFDFYDGDFIAVYLQINPVRDDAYTLTQLTITTDPQVIDTKLDLETIRATK